MTVTMHNTPNLNDEVATMVGKFARHKTNGDKMETGLVSVLRVSGFKSTDCISPKSNNSTATDESFSFLKDSVINGLPKGVKELIEMSAKAAGDKLVDGRNRSYWSKQPNSIVAAIGRALKKQEEIDAEIAAGNAAPDTRTRTPEMMVRDGLADCVKRIQKADTFKADMDIDDIIKAINALIKRIG